MSQIRGLVIIPTKNRREMLQTQLGNLSVQNGAFDIFIGDMCTDPHHLEGELLDKLIQSCNRAGHTVFKERVQGHNQLFGYNAGLKFASTHSYEFGIGTDDDILFEPGWFDSVLKRMWVRPEVSTYVGLTLIPWVSLAEQSRPWHLDAHPDHMGRLKECLYYHCTLIPSDLSPKEYEQVYGAFGFRVQDYVDVGGFPEYLSPLGFRGEMMAQTATFFAGKKLVVDPTLVSWHYSCFEGGLRQVQGDLRSMGMDHDMKLWNAFVARRTPSTSRCESI